MSSDPVETSPGSGQERPSEGRQIYVKRPEMDGEQAVESRPERMTAPVRHRSGNPAIANRPGSGSQHEARWSGPLP